MIDITEEVPLWRDDDGFIARGTGDDYVTIADCDCSDLDIDEREAYKALFIAAPTLLKALEGCVGETTTIEHAETVDSAANLTAIDWTMRAVENLRTLDDGQDTIIGDVLDDLSRAISRMQSARAVIAQAKGQVA